MSINQAISPGGTPGIVVIKETQSFSMELALRKRRLAGRYESRIQTFIKQTGRAGISCQPELTVHELQRLDRIINRLNEEADLLEVDQIKSQGKGGLA